MRYEPLSCMLCSLGWASLLCVPSWLYQQKENGRNPVVLRAGILLAVTIIYQYFETYEKEKVQSASLW